MIVLPSGAGHRIGLLAHGYRLGLAGRIALGALAVGKPEVVDHGLVEQPGSVLEDPLEPILGGHVRVAGDAAPAGGTLADTGRGHAAGNLNPAA